MTDRVERVADVVCGGHLAELPPAEKKKCRIIARNVITAYEAALAEEGYVVVPREPTVEMFEAAADADPCDWDDSTPFDFPAECHGKIYDAMLTAALAEEEGS